MYAREVIRQFEEDDFLDLEAPLNLYPDYT